MNKSKSFANSKLEALTAGLGKPPRILNLMFFVGTGKVRRIAIQLHRIYVAAGICVVLMAWSVVTWVLISSNSSQIAAMTERKSKTLESILSYQINYENVFERVYQTNESPDSQTSPTPIAPTP